MINKRNIFLSLILLTSLMSGCQTEQEEFSNETQEELSNENQAGLSNENQEENLIEFLGYVSGVREEEEVILVIPDIERSVLMEMTKDEALEFAARNGGIYFYVEAGETEPLEKGMKVKVVYDQSQGMEDSVPPGTLAESVEVIE